VVRDTSGRTSIVPVLAFGIWAASSTARVMSCAEFLGGYYVLDLRSRVALTLRTLGGLSTSEIARAFLVSESAMGKRIVRAK
jgi:hypothetical protein